jgi:hypothetical protein
MLRAQSFGCDAPVVTIGPNRAAKVCVMLLPTSDNAANEVRDPQSVRFDWDFPMQCLYLLTYLLHYSGAQRTGQGCHDGHLRVHPPDAGRDQP